MEISIVQAVLIGLWTAFSYAGMLWGIYTNRAIVLSFGVGVILGDVPTALQVGAVAELAFMGFGVGAGGTVPPNPIGPGIIGTLMAITMPNVDASQALALSFPFAIAIQFLQTGIYALRSGAPESVNRALSELDFKKYKRTVNLTVILFAVVGFFLGFLGSYSMPLLEKLVNLVPEFLMKGLTVAGGMLPAIGFGMILSVMLSKKEVPYAILGYVLAAYFELPVIGIALIGLIFALKYYEEITNKKTAVVAQETGGGQDGWI